VFNELYWIDVPWPGRLAISARPRGGDWLEDELKSWRAAGVTKVVSLLTPGEEDALGLEQEKQAALEAGLFFLSFPIVDRSVPSSDGEATRVIEELDGDLTHGQHLVVHCRQGIGRSGLIASALLVARGIAPDDATTQVGHGRRVTVPETLPQIVWVNDFPKTWSAASLRSGGR
jgi:protein-tyrosine phosphatase